MTTSPEENKPSPEDGLEVVGDIDLLIADAENAALATVREEASENQNKATVAREKAARAEQLQELYDHIAEDDELADLYGYEWALDTAEEETGIAASDNIRTLIAAFKKSGAALRRLSVAESTASDDLAEKLIKLRAAHKNLFAQIKPAVSAALEAIKNKYQGETAEFEAKYAEVMDSPLIRGLEYNPNSPEARERALKQEIIELFQGPAVEHRLRLIEEGVQNDRNKLSEASKILVEVKQAIASNISNDKAKQLASKIADKFNWRKDIWLFDIERQLPAIIEQATRQSEKSENLLQGNQLAFSTNRILLERLLEDEHDEGVLREGLDELNAFLNNIRAVNVRRGENRRDLPDVGPEPKNALAQKVLSHYVIFGATMPDDIIDYRDREKKFYQAPADMQLVYDKNTNGASHEDDDTLITRARLVNRQAWRSFLKTRLPDVPDEVINLLCPSYRPNVTALPKFLDKNYKDYSLASATKPPRDVFYKNFPDPNVLAARLLADKGELLNLRRACTRMNSSLPLLNKMEDWEAIVKALVANGWKETTLGALVEPGQNTRQVNRSYDADLERLSAPQMEAERAFDVRGPEGEFHVYTLRQAIDLLRRARRDARAMAEKADKSHAELTDTASQVEKQLRDTIADLERRLARLEQDKAQAAEQAHAKEKDLSERLAQALREKDDWRRQAQQAQAEKNKLVEGVQTALKQKTGMFGSEKGLRAELTKLVPPTGESE